MDELDNYLLAVIATFPLKRKSAFLFAVVTGKRTGQAVQDSHLFDATPLFGCVPMLKQTNFDARLERLRTKGLLTITEDGVELLEEAEISFRTRFPYIDGFAYQNRTNAFFERLLLVIQVLSNFKHDVKHYLPIVRDDVAQLAVKHWLVEHLTESTKEAVRGRFYLELEQWLREMDGALYVPRFSGGNYIGKTALQVAEELGCTPWEYYFEWLNGLHYLFAKMTQNFPLLDTLMPNVVQGLTSSARKTWQLTKQGVSFEKMAAKRNLKESTIQDHIVEIAATIPEFSVYSWVDRATITAISDRQWHSLKDIKQAFPTLDYFQIRLALIAKRSDMICS
ncbi:helix-turn-helix domain-containing protein [Listeria rocourtiae]|uniref:helix-turn-helix domain-containing protein n=1 Tax=Listeria rocourtiae TaxID=647910 RepID=UPI003D2F6C15